MNSDQWARRPWKQLRNESNWKLTRGGTFETKDKSITHFPKTLRSGMWQRSRWAEAVTVPCTINWGHVNVDTRQKLFSGCKKVLAATIYRMLTWLVASKFFQLSATTVVAISAGICPASMSMLAVSLCVYARKPFIISMLCHVAV